MSERADNPAEAVEPGAAGARSEAEEEAYGKFLAQRYLERMTAPIVLTPQDEEMLDRLLADSRHRQVDGPSTSA